MSKYFIGIDIGTTNIKSVLFDSNFKQVFSASRSNENIVDTEICQEQDMYAIMDKVIDTLSQVVSESNVSSPDIVAIGLSGQGEGVWLIDDSGKPVQNAILWSDLRSSDLVSKLDPVIKDQITRITGSEPMPCNQTMILTWIAKNKPELLDKAAHCLFSKDWVRYGLTGQISLEVSDVGTSVMDLSSGEVSTDVLEGLGLIQYKHLFPKILPSNQICGTITKEIVEATGLNENTIVAIGGLDVSCAALGLGASADGDAFSILGTTCCTGIITENNLQRNVGTRCVPHVYPGLFIDLIATLSGTPNIDWLLKSISDTKDFFQIEELIKDTRTGSGGVWYHPYISGERAPFFNPNARASFFGINRETTRSHLIRAVYEGLSYTIKDALKVAPKGSHLYLAGGGVSSDTWLQIIADMTNRTVVVSASSELSAKGAAMLAGMATEYITNAKDPCYFEIVKEVVPIPANVAKYDDYYQVYKKFQEQAHDLWNLRTKVRGKYRK